MDQFTGPKIRNVVLLSHSGAGKTSLAEAMLFASKGISRLGSVGDGNTVSDFDPEEQRRETSLQLAVIPCVWKGTKVNLLDTPGYADFIGETVSALRAADAAVVVVSAASGVEVGTELVWERVREAGLPVIVFVSKMDREHADFAAALAQIRAKLGNRCAAVNLPIGAEASFSGVADLVAGDVPADAQADAGAARDQLAEAVAETDDDLTLKFLEEERLSAEEIASGLRAGVRTGAVVPVLTGSSMNGAGIGELLDAIVDYLPAPTDAPPVKAEKGGTEVELTADPAGPLAAFVFKTSADPFVGKLSYIRVVSGTLASNSEVWDSKTSEAERVSQVFVSIGKHQENVPSLVAGDIGSVAKLSHAVTGSTLTTKDAAIALPPVEFPPAVYNVAVHPKSKADHDKLSVSLARLIEEDPSLHLSRDPSTAETIVAGLGDTHVEVMAERAKRKFGVEIELAPPRVPYQETVSKVTKAEYRHKKQSGGHGQYGHVVLRLEPNGRGEGFSFKSEVVGGTVPREYIPAVEKGVQKRMGEGALAGFPIVDVKVVLIDGSSHAVDSSGQSFEIAGSMAMRQGVLDAAPTLLEPIMKVHITAPEQFAGAVVGDLNTRRSHIQGMSPEGGIAYIDAEMPRSEAQQYSTQLRALTQGRGVLTMEFGHYGQVPPNLVERIVQSTQEATKA
ncbi:MAG: elongation factor G [Chloroflexi bacterium]|nr:elongation factor G [Chloroflexota bacterium]MCH7654402.1 elongation factor G [Chloroflexota bacterium]